MQKVNLEQENTVAIVGAGTMGSGIAQKYASSGYKVILVDKNQQCLELSKQVIKKTLQQAVERNIFSSQKSSKIFNNLIFTDQLDKTTESCLIIEAINEDLVIKKKLYNNLEQICATNSIIASNTSSFLLRDLAAELKYPERFLGLHYFYHPAKNRLVELVGQEKTAPEFIFKAQEIQEKINKIVIKSKDSPGFIVNRFFVPWLNESMRMVHENICTISTIEFATKKFWRIPMGPFELMNITGLPITLHSCHSLARTLGEFYAPCPLIIPHIETKTNWELCGKIQHEKYDIIIERLMGVINIIANQIVHEERVASLADVDLGARVGLLWHKGPFELFNSTPKNIFAKGINYFSQTKKLIIPDILKNKIQTNTKFDSPLVTINTQNQSDIICLNKPESLNSLDNSLLESLTHAFDVCQKNNNSKNIIISGHARAFMAGADLEFFNTHIANNQINKIINFAQKAQDLFLKIDQSNKPVVAAIDGLALGGGLELALACDAIVASNRARFGFPETSIGIYPGLGGTQRTPKKIGLELARFLILTGTILNTQEAYAMGLIDAFCTPSQLIEKAQEISKNIPQSSHTKIRDFQDLTQIFAQPIDLSSMPQNQNLSERAQKALDKINKNAPLALQTAEDLLQQAQETPLELGLQHETQKLNYIFATQDAKEGLLCARNKQQAKFSGN